MNIKRILSTALLVVMVFTSVICAFPISADAAYSSASNAATVKVPEGTKEANLSEEGLAEYYNYILTDYNSAKFGSVEELIDYELGKGYLYYANSSGNTHSIYVNKYTGVLYYVNNLTGQILTSNPIAPADLGNTRAKELLMSQIVIDYVETENPTSTGATDFNSFGQAASRGQISVTTIKGGLRVNYTLGDTTTRFLLPGMLKADEFVESIVKPMLSNFEELLVEYCSEEMIDETTFNFFENEDYVPYKNGCFNDNKRAKGLKLFLEDMETVMKACYPTSKDKTTTEYKALRAMFNDIQKVTQSYALKNPAEYIGNDRYQKDLEEMYAEYPATQDGTAIYVYSNYEIDSTKRDIANRIKRNCPEYTFAKMFEQEKAVGYVDVSPQKAVFRCALEYTFNADGSLNASLPASSIVFDETVYTLNSITPLQYFGGLDMRDDGYIFYPDGSGAIIDFNDFYNEENEVAVEVKSPIYGLDYCYSMLTDIEGITHRAQVTMPVFGAMTEREATSLTKLLYGVDTVKDGYFAILEDGASLATLRVSGGGANIYVGTFAYYNPRPADEFDLSEVLSVGSLGSKYKIVSESKYTGSFTTRYVMLTDERIGDTLYGKDAYYASDYSGMASYYRNYLKDSGVLTSLENLGEDIPLYLEVLGAMNITSKFLTFPVTESIPLTSFEDIAVIYEELSQCETYVIRKVAEYRQLASVEEDDVQKYQYERQAERYEELIGKIQDIKNINFKMTGFANGGVDSTYPAKLKWAKACGGNDGYAELVKKANEISSVEGQSFKLYPEFDFMYINRTDSFDGIDIEEITAKMVDNRYASTQVYNSVSQEFENVVTLVVSSDSLESLFAKFNSKYSAYENNGISVSTLGSDLNSNFDEENPINREEALGYVEGLLDTMANADGYDIMVDTGNIYAVEYANHIINAAIDSSHHRYTSYTVPFVGLVLHSYVNYTGEPINYSGSPAYDMLRAIESGASLYYILCYQNTSYMKDNKLLSKYYGVDYVNWFDEIVENYAYLNSMIGDLQNYEIYDHEILIAERVIEEDELKANFSKLGAEIVSFLDAQLLSNIDDAIAALKGDPANYPKRILLEVDREALYADFAEILNVTVEELKAEHESFIASVEEVIVKYETEFAGAADESNNVVVVFDDFEYGTEKYSSKYTYITDSFAQDEDYVETDYSITNGNVTMVTYRLGDDVVRFILNYNSFDINVKLSATETYELSAYGCVRID